MKCIAGRARRNAVAGSSAFSAFMICVALPVVLAVYYFAAAGRGPLCRGNQVCHSLAVCHRVHGYHGVGDRHVLGHLSTTTDSYMVVDFIETP